MNQMRGIEFGIIALSCIFVLANSQKNGTICVPLGSVPSQQTNPELPVACSQPGYYVNQTNPSNFYKCHGGMMYSFECQPGFIFNSTKIQCVRGEKITCNPLEGACLPGSSIFILPQPTNCANLLNGNNNNSFNLVAFFQCLGGKLFENRCPEGLLFNAIENKCEYENKMTCFNTP